MYSSIITVLGSTSKPGQEKAITINKCNFGSMETALGEGEMYESSSKSQNFLETNYLTDVCDSNVITL